MSKPIYTTTGSFTVREVHDPKRAREQAEWLARMTTKEHASKEKGHTAQSGVQQSTEQAAD